MLYFLITSSSAALQRFCAYKRIFALWLCSWMFVLPAAGAQSVSYEHAEDLVRSHQWDEGLSELAPLLKREPHNLKALNLAGLALIGKGDIQQADKYFKTCIGIDPAFVPALKNLSINEFNAGQYSAAEKYLLAAQKASPDDPVIHLYLGEISYRKRQYRPAVEEFRLAASFISRNTMASTHLAVSYLMTNNQEEALAILDTLQPAEIDPKTQFQLALALDQAGLPQRALLYLGPLRQQFPNSYEIGFDLMLIDLETKNFLDAIQTGQDLIARGHDEAELNNILAQAHEGNGETQLAVDAYRKAIALDPRNEQNYLDLASLCINQGYTQAGMNVVDSGLRLHPGSPRLIFMRGVLHAIQNDYEQAEADFKLSEELSPQQDLGYVGLGASYIQTGHDVQAIQVLRQRLRNNPNDAGLLYLLGESLIHTGASPGSASYTEAQTALEKSVRLNPNLCKPHIYLGTIYLGENRLKDAVVQLEAARAIDPNDRSAYSHLAIAYRKSGQAAKAKEVLIALESIITRERLNSLDQMKAQNDRMAEQSTALAHHAASDE